MIDIENTSIKNRLSYAITNAFAFCSETYNLRDNYEWKDKATLPTEIMQTEQEIYYILVKRAYKGLDPTDRQKVIDFKAKVTADDVILGEFKRNKESEDKPNAYELHLRLIHLSDLTLLYPNTIFLSNSDVDDTHKIQEKIMLYIKLYQICAGITDDKVNKLKEDLVKPVIKKEIEDMKDLMNQFIKIEYDYPNNNDKDLQSILKSIESDNNKWVLYLNQKIIFYLKKLNELDEVTQPNTETLAKAINIYSILLDINNLIYSILKNEKSTTKETLISLTENGQKYKEYIEKLKELFPKEIKATDMHEKTN